MCHGCADPQRIGAGLHRVVGPPSRSRDARQWTLNRVQDPGSARVSGGGNDQSAAPRRTKIPSRTYRMHAFIPPVDLDGIGQCGFVSLCRACGERDSSHRNGHHLLHGGHWTECGSLCGHHKVQGPNVRRQACDPRALAAIHGFGGGHFDRRLGACADCILL